MHRKGYVLLFWQLCSVTFEANLACSTTREMNKLRLFLSTIVQFRSEYVTNTAIFDSNVDDNTTKTINNNV